MFGKLKRRLALIYTGIFALILVIVVAATVVIGGLSAAYPLLKMKKKC